MNKQRLAVLIVAITGIVATFLPWYRIQDIAVFGLFSSGWFTLLMFVIVIILGIRKNSQEDMSVSWSITIFSFLGSFVVLWMMIDIYFA